MGKERLDIVDRVINWNAARYDQVFNYELAVKLLLEETDELNKAFTVVEQLDAIGDISFVAIGVLWKLGVPTDIIKQIFYGTDMTTLDLLQAHDMVVFWQHELMDSVDHRADGAWPGLVLTLHSAFLTCLGKLIGINMQDYYYDIVEAICDSNDTKEIKGKVDPSVKANINKGASFVPPTARLTKIMEASWKAQADKKSMH